MIPFSDHHAGSERTSQFQLTANLRYFFSAVIQNSHKDIIYPDVSEIVSTSIPMMNWNGNFNTKLPKSAVSKILLSEKNFLLWPVRCAIIWTEILPNRSPRNLFRIFLAIMRNIFPHFSNQNSVSLPVNISSELRLKMAKTLLQNNPDILTKESQNGRLF